MQLMSFTLPAADGGYRYGAVLDDTVVDLAAAMPALGLTDAPPRTLLDLIRAGEAGMDLARRALRDLATAPPQLRETIAHPLNEVRFLPPLPDSSKVIAVGRNYADHIGELGISPPRLPKLFAKFPCNAVGHRADIVRPPGDHSLDYEAEVAFVVGRTARHVPIEEAYDYIFGYTIANDVCVRDIQFTDEQVTLAKNFRTFAPSGPFLATADSVTDPAALAVRLWLNDRLMQDGNTRDLIFSMPYLLSFISSVMDLEPGDMVLTGTPAGVGYGQDPPAFLQPGDWVRIEVDQLGRLENTVVQDNRPDAAAGQPAAALHRDTGRVGA
jgi:acylpyruvate hydrolase